MDLFFYLRNIYQNVSFLSFMDIYEPAEDSYLLQESVRKEAYGRVLDLGTGSGIQALTAVESSKVREIVAVDINEKAVSSLKKRLNQQKVGKISVFKSDLFENVSGKFNMIIFNPPYLPQDEGIDDLALYGGKKGWEISERFFKEVSKYLISDGKILFLFSTLTNKDKIEEIISHNLFEFKQLGSKKIAFEELYVYEIVKSKLLRELEAKLLENITYFTEGKRGLIYTADLERSKLIKSHFAKKNKIKVAIKAEKRGLGRVANEITWLKVLNKRGIGPKLLFHSKEYFVYPFIEGEFILDWIKDKSKKEIKQVLSDVMGQCYILDKLFVTKEEMHHPHKHILIDKYGKAHLLDFERCTKTDKPKNVTQFVEFICRIGKELDNKGFNVKVELLRGKAKEYKKEMKQELLDDFLSLID